MAKLITNHDPYHIHKILGLLVLLNYLYRLCLVFTLGTSFPSDEPLWQSTACVTLYGILSWSSLLLPLPAKRNFNSPMIWPEFRWPSINFASRHVLATLLTLNGMWPQSSSILWNAFTRCALLLTTTQAASYVTDKYGCREQRTTNSMPYPNYVTPEQQQLVKTFYARSQFGATATCLLNDPTIQFAPTLAIQMAPLLMTLVRKGKVSSAVYHRVYAIALYLGYIMVWAGIFTSAQASTLQALACLSFPTAHFRAYLHPPQLWIFQVVCTLVLYPIFLAPHLQEYVTEKALFWITLVGFVHTSRRQWTLMKPLFLSDDANLSSSSSPAKVQ
jgi:hypothetical protein